MADYYSNKKQCLDELVRLIKGATMAGKKAHRTKLELALIAKYAFSRVIRDYIKGLIDSKSVKVSYDEDGTEQLEWVAPL